MGRAPRCVFIESRCLTCRIPGSSSCECVCYDSPPPPGSIASYMAYREIHGFATVGHFRSVAHQLTMLLRTCSRTLCPSGLRGWTQVPLARAAWAQIPQVSIMSHRDTPLYASGASDAQHNRNHFVTPSHVAAYMAPQNTNINTQRGIATLLNIHAEREIER